MQYLAVETPGGLSDFVPAYGTLTFAPGQTTATIIVKVRGDQLDERNEKFFVQLFGATGATLADDRGVGLILDDDWERGHWHW